MVSVGIRGEESASSGCGVETSRAAALFAAFAFAICSLNAADDFRAEVTEWASSEATVSAVLVDVVDAFDGFVPSQEVAEDLCEADETFLGVPAAGVLSSADMDGFLKRPVREGLGLTERDATDLDPSLDAGTSGMRFSGLGVLDRPNPTVAGGGILAPEARTEPPRAGCEGVLKDRKFPRPLVGVPSMVVSGFL